MLTACILSFFLVELSGLVLVDESLAQDEPAANEATATPVTIGDVRQGLRRLEAAELKTRDAAEQELIDLGGGVLPFLPAITANTSGEMKVRLQRIRRALQNSGIETFFNASKITLQGTFTVADAVKNIEEQTQNEIEIGGGDSIANTEVNLSYVDADFWDVIWDIMDQAKLRINAYGTTTGELVLAPGGSESEINPFLRGPFYVEPISAQSKLFFNSQLDGQLSLSLQVSWEPRLKPVYMQIPMRTIEAKVGEETLAASNAQAAPEIPLNLGTCTTQIDLQVARPQRSAKMIDMLSGEFIVAVPSERHEYVFEKFANGARQTQKYGDVTVVLDGARRNNQVYEMRLFIQFGDAQGALESYRGWIMSNEAYLLDANDNRIENVGSQTSPAPNGAVGMSYLFQINGDVNTYKLVYESPGAITKQTVRYELKDIPLP